MATAELSTGSSWQRWLLPDRPGLRQALLGIVALLLPLLCIGGGVRWYVPALIASLTIGCGLALAWTALTGWQWLRLAPATTLCVLGLHGACLINLELLPRWEVLLRAQAAKRDLAFWWQHRADTPALPMPTYDTGRAALAFNEVADPASRIVAYTPVALQRWSILGERESCWVALTRDGNGELLRTREELAALLPAAERTRLR